MGNKFTLKIAAVDEFSKVFRRLEGNAERASRIASSSFGVANRSVMGFSRSIESLGVRSTMLTALGGGLAGGAAVRGFAQMMSSAGRQAAAATRFTQAHGMSLRDLQRLEGAATLKGIDRDAASAALGGLGGKLQDILSNRDQEGQFLLNRVGVKVRRNADGSPDTARVLGDIAEAVRSQRNPEAAGALINRLGLEVLGPLLREGASGVRNLSDETERLGGVMSDAGVKNLTAFDDSVKRLSLSLRGTLNFLAEEFGPGATKVVDELTKNFTRESTIWDKIMAGGLWDVFSGKAARDYFYGPPDRSRQRGAGTLSGGFGEPLGLRQNNPGNLRSWFGTPTQNGFARFESAQAGLTAMAQQIGLYGSRDGLRSIAGIVSKYAPSSENNTGAYISSIARQTGFNPNAALDTSNPTVLSSLMSAMVRQEQGRQPFTPQQYQKAAQDAVQKLQIEVVVSDSKTRVHVRDSAGNELQTRVAYSLPGSGAR